MMGPTTFVAKLCFLDHSSYEYHGQILGGKRSPENLLKFFCPRVIPDLNISKRVGNIRFGKHKHRALICNAVCVLTPPDGEVTVQNIKTLVFCHWYDIIYLPLCFGGQP